MLTKTRGKRIEEFEPVVREKAGKMCAKLAMHESGGVVALNAAVIVQIILYLANPCGSFA